MLLDATCFVQFGDRSAILVLGNLRARVIQHTIETHPVYPVQHLLRVDCTGNVLCMPVLIVNGSTNPTFRAIEVTGLVIATRLIQHRAIHTTSSLAKS